MNLGNQRMLKPGQRLLLAGEALPPVRREQPVAQELDRHQAADIIASGQIDAAHPALAEESNDPVRTQGVFRGESMRTLQQGLRDGRQAFVDHRLAASVSRQHGQQFSHQRLIAPACLSELALLLRRRQIRYVMKDFLYAFPASAVHRNPSFRSRSNNRHRNQRSLRISASNHALATLQSRSTVLLETPSAATISGTSSPPKNRSSTVLA
jgi:hypothetical protein